MALERHSCPWTACQWHCHLTDSLRLIPVCNWHCHARLISFQSSNKKVYACRISPRATYEQVDVCWWLANWWWGDKGWTNWRLIEWDSQQPDKSTNWRSFRQSMSANCVSSWKTIRLSEMMTDIVWKLNRSADTMQDRRRAAAVLVRTHPKNYTETWCF